MQPSAVVGSGASAPELRASTWPVLTPPAATGAFRVAATFLTESVAHGEYLLDFSTDSLTAAERATPVHDGIGSGDCEGLSNIYYWTGKRWVRFPGGDRFRLTYRLMLESEYTSV